MWSSRGRLLASWPVADTTEALGAPTVGVSRADLHPVLVDALGEDSVRTGAACVSYTQDADAVEAQLSNGMVERADVLVGADGLHSTIREQALGPTALRDAGYTVWQAIIDFPVTEAPLGSFRVVWGPGARFAHYRVGGGRLYWFAVTDAPADGRDAPGTAKADLLRRFAGWPVPAEAIVEATAPEAISRMGVYDRKPVKRWSDGRVTLLGDAAHAMTFNVGQGACMAIEDAIVLARALDAPADVAGALRVYERERIPRTTTVVRVSRTVGAFGRLRQPLACHVRDRVMARMFSGFLHRRHQQDMAYAFGPHG
jgi:2-polyprenyl-6-methoxyphenol hydroxylase-like FAD-dependent oxidoreductase